MHESDSFDMPCDPVLILPPLTLPRNAASSRPLYHISHSSLPTAHSEYCLTGFLPSDIPRMPPIWNHPDVRPTFGYHGFMTPRG